MPGPPYELRIIFAEEFRRQIRNKGFLFFTVLIVGLMVAAIPLTPVVVDLIESETDATAAEAADAQAAAAGGEALSRVGYADPAGVLPGTGAEGSPPWRYDSRAAGIEDVRSGRIDTLFVLPADYIESGRIEDYWTTRERGPVWASNGRAEGDFRAFLRARLTAGRDIPAELSRAIDPGWFEQFDVPDTPGGIEETGASVAQGLVELLALLLFAVLFMVAVMTGGGTIIRSVSEEKETRMVELLITSASPLSILAGKLLAVVLAGLAHIAVWIAVGALVTPVIFDRIPNAGELAISGSSLVIVAFCFVLGYVLFSAFSMFVGTVVNSTAEGQRQTGLLSLLVGLPIWMTGLIVNIPDALILKIATYVPFFAPTLIMVRRGAGSDMSDGEIAAALAIVAVTAVVMTWIAARVFSVGILLSGQSVSSPRNLLAALRRAE